MGNVSKMCLRLLLPVNTIIWLLVFCSIECKAAPPVKINVQFAQHCKNAIECFSSIVQCTGSHEILNLNLKVSSVHNEISDRQNLFISSSHLQFKLQMDKTVPHYSVTKTHKTNAKSKVPMTEEITDSVFYKKDYKFLKQFKTINEFYGTIEGANGTAFVRAIVHFVNCGRLLLFAFVRQNDILYQIRPSLDNLNDLAGNLKDENIHEIFTITSGIDSDIFSSKSNAIAIAKEMIRRRRENSGDNYYCVTSIIADQSFYNQMNSNFEQVVIYIKVAFMLFNEIYVNSNWEYENQKNYKVVLPQIDIDLTITNELSHFSDDQIVNTLYNFKDRSSSFCLMHLFTNHSISQNGFSQHGFSYLGSYAGGAFHGENNTGATSIGLCGDDPWRIQCLLNFPREMAHSLGSKYEQYSFLLSNNEAEEIEPSDLKLSPKSLDDISNHIYHNLRNRYSFLPANQWSKCGNAIVEEGEQCDEGPFHLCCDPKCRLLNSNQCSPLNSLCCNQDCKFKQTNEPACLPWNYCNDERVFCQGRESYCQFEKINIDCDATSTTTNKFNETTTIYPNIKSTPLAVMIGLIIGFIIVVATAILVCVLFGRFSFSKKPSPLFKDSTKVEDEGTLEEDGNNSNCIPSKIYTIEDFIELLNNNVLQLSKMKLYSNAKQSEEFKNLFTNFKLQLIKAKPADPNESSHLLEHYDRN